MLGWEDEDLLGRELKTLLHPEDQHLVDVLHGADCGAGFRRELWLRHVSGQWVWAEVSGVLGQRSSYPAVDSHWLFVARNVVDERKARDHLARAHRLEGAGAMAAGLAHDFNNLIMVLRGYAELLPPSRECESIVAVATEAGDQGMSPGLRVATWTLGGQALIEVESRRVICYCSECMPLSV